MNRSTLFFLHYFISRQSDLDDDLRIYNELINYENNFSSSKFIKILADLKSNDDPKILDAVIQLCTHLSMADESSLLGFNLEHFIPCLLNCLKKELIPDILIHTTSCIFHILELFPAARKMVVQLGGISLLCEKMQKFEYIDVAENSIKALEKLSIDYGEEILNNGTIPLIMNIIDFFYNNIQNSMLNIVANAFNSIPNESSLTKNVLNLLPILNKFLSTDQSKEEVFSLLYWKLIDRIARIFEEDFDKKQSYIELIADKTLLEKIFSIIQKGCQEGIPSKRIETMKNLFRLLNKVCYYSPKNCLACFRLKLISYLDKIFSISETLSKDSQEFSNLLLEAILLINSVLSLRTNPHPLISQISPLVGIKILENTKANEKLEIFKVNKELMFSLIEVFHQRVTILFERNNSLLYKYIVLIILEKIVIFSNPSDLIKCSNFSLLSQFLYRLLQSFDLMTVVLSLLIIEAFLSKAPTIINEFWREGVIEQIKLLKSEKEVNKLTFVSLSRGGQRSNEQKVQGFASSNSTVSNLKYESVAEKMKNLNNLINKIDKNINEIYQPKLISNIKNSAEKKADHTHHAGKQNLINSVLMGKKGGEFPAENLPGEKLGLLEEKASFMNEYNATKMNFIKKDIVSLISDLHEKIRSVSTSKNHSENSEKIHFLLNEITSSIKNSNDKHHDPETSVFEKMLAFLSKYKKFTNYEIKTHHLISSLNDYIFEGLLNHRMDICDEKPEISFSNFDNNEISRGTESEPFPEIDISEDQANRIIRKIFAFSNFLLSKNPNNPQNLVLHNINESLQELISSIESESKNMNLFRNLDNSSNLAQDLKFLSQRIRFKVRFNENFEALFLPKSKSAHLRDKNLGMSVFESNNFSKNFSKECRDIMEYKESLLKEIPLLVLSIEQFGTLEIIEDFLLNKITGKNDVQYGGIFHSIFNKIKRNIGKNELFQSKNKKEEIDCELDENFDENDNDEHQREEFESGEENEKEDLEENQRKKPNSFVLSKKPQKILKVDNPGKDLKFSEISIKKKFSGYEKSPLKVSKNTIFESISNSNINFKKYLEVNFFIKNIDVPKNVTIYEIMQKFKNSHIFQEDSIILDYRITIKENNGVSCTSMSQSLFSRQHHIKSPLLHRRQIMQALLKKLQSIGCEAQKEENFDDFKPILQFFVLIIDICKNYTNYFSPSSSFYPTLKSPIFPLKPGITLEETFRAHSLLLEGLKLKFFENSRISHYLLGVFNDPILIASGFIPEFFSLLASKTLCLINFATRQEFFKNLKFPVSRSLYFIYHANKDKLKELESLRIGKLRRKKIKTSRDKVIENAISHFDSYGAKKHVLEFEFFEEEGSGLGPTLEYFSLVSQEIMKLDKLLWRKTEEGSVFPSPLPSLKFHFAKKQSKDTDIQGLRDKAQTLWRMIGTLVGRAIIDERLIDLPIHNLFWDLVLDRPVYLGDIKKVDKKLGETLLGLQELVMKKHEIEKNETIPVAIKTQQIERLNFKGCPIEDLCLDFTFPGQSEILMIEDGNNKTVDIKNLEQYVELCFRFFFVETLRLQIRSFKEGIEKVVPLHYFTPILSEEIEQLYCGIAINKKWEKNELFEHILPAYGYTSTSPTYIDFINILCELTPEEQKMLLKFVTGSPRLPIGGFKNLNPKLTVVKKQPDNFEQCPDEFLPSVMTCQNYLKLPEYSSPSILKEKLKYAIVEGQNSFSLS